MLEVSESTVKRRLYSFGISISSKYADLSEEELDTIDHYCFANTPAVSKNWLQANDWLSFG